MIENSIVLQAKKKKNISEDPLGKTLGRVHMGAQKLKRIQTRKMKGLRKTIGEKKEERKRKRMASNVTTSSKQVKIDT